MPPRDSSRSLPALLRMSVQMSLQLAVLLTLALGGCENDAAPAETTDAGHVDVPAPTAWLTVLDVLSFTRGKDGVAPGFNIDGVVSADGDEASCGKSDFIAPWGATGVDNQFARLVPLIELSGIGALEGIVEAVIKDGGLLILVQLEGVDDQKNDSDVRLRVRLGSGAPLLGTDGQVLAGQTFHLHDNSPETTLNGTIVDGLLTTNAVDTELPIVVFGVGYALKLRKAQFRGRLTESGGLTDGFLGGAVPITSILEIAKKAEEGQKGVYDLVSAIMETAGDLSRDKDTGLGTEISATFGFSSVSAFLMDDKLAP